MRTGLLFLTHLGVACLSFFIGYKVMHHRSVNSNPERPSPSASASEETASQELGGQAYHPVSKPSAESSPSEAQSALEKADADIHKIEASIAARENQKALLATQITALADQIDQLEEQKVSGLPSQNYANQNQQILERDLDREERLKQIDAQLRSQGARVQFLQNQVQQWTAQGFDSSELQAARTQLSAANRQYRQIQEQYRQEKIRAGVASQTEKQNLQLKQRADQELAINAYLKDLDTQKKRYDQLVAESQKVDQEIQKERNRLDQLRQSQQEIRQNLPQ